MGQSYSKFRPWKHLAILSLGLVTGTAFSQDAPTLSQQGRDAFDQKQYAKSAELYLAATQKDPTRVFDWLAAARAFARTGNRDEAFRCLGEVASRGYDAVDATARDPDLAPLRSDARWAEFEAKIKVNFESNASVIRDGWATRTPYRPDLTEDEKVLGLSKLWSLVKYNFVNFNLVPELDWDQLYADYLPRVRQTKSTLEYYNVLRELVAKLKDGHTNVFPPSELANQFCRPPVRTGLIEGRVIVTAVADAAKASGLRPGMELLEIDGVPVRTYGETRVMPYVSTSAAANRLYLTFGSYLLEGPQDRPVALKVRGEDGKEIEARLNRLAYNDWARGFNRPSYEFKMLPGNVAYVYLGTFVPSDIPTKFLADFAQIRNASSLVIDVRNNGGGNDGNWFPILGSLVSPTFDTYGAMTMQYSPNVQAYGGFTNFSSRVNTINSETADPFRKPVAVLANGFSFSAAEDFLLAFDANKRGIIVGEPSAGTSGMPLSFDLPGGIQGRVCTMRIYHADGRQFQAIGVQPDLLVHPTIADIRSGRDTILEAALAALKKGGRA